MLRRLLLLRVLLVVLVLADWTPAIEVGTKPMTFKMPDQSAEDQHASYLPPKHRCDVCEAVTHHMKEKLAMAEKRARGRALTESDLMDVFETSICPSSVYEEYGLKRIAETEEDRISGPGTWAEEMAGLVAGGGKWPRRMSDYCTTIASEYEEKALYDLYRGGLDLTVQVCGELTKDCSMGYLRQRGYVVRSDL